VAAADKLFGEWVMNKQSRANEEQTSSQTQQEDPTSSSQQQQQQQQQPAAATEKRNQPTEVILRGYRATVQQYASIAHYESLAGPILEDYPREPPSNQRRYKSQLRDAAFTRRRALTHEEHAKVSKAASGEHWVKVTFESSEAAEMAFYASPQRILGHLVYAEPYRQAPPAKDEACPDLDATMEEEHIGRSRSVPAALGSTNRANGPTSWTSRLLDVQREASGSQISSSHTVDTGTVSSGTVDQPATASGFAVAMTATSVEPLEMEDEIFCRRIPTARKAKILPAEQALRPQQSFVQRFVAAIPLLSWFGGSIIGSEVPRTETGEFDWNRASLYWKVVWWLDATFGLFKGDVSSIDKDD
jgi:hypothetical protein